MFARECAVPAGRIAAQQPSPLIAAPVIPSVP